MGVPEPPCWAKACPQDHCKPSVRLFQLCWCLAGDPGTAPLEQQVLSQQPPWLASVPCWPCCAPLDLQPLPLAGSFVALSMTSWAKLGGLTRGQQRTNRRLS